MTIALSAVFSSTGRVLCRFLYQLCFSSCLIMFSMNSYHPINLQAQQLQMMQWIALESSYVVPRDVMPHVTVTCVRNMNQPLRCLSDVLSRNLRIQNIFSEFTIFITRPTVTCCSNPFWHETLCHYAKCRRIANYIRGCSLYLLWYSDTMGVIAAIIRLSIVYLTCAGAPAYAKQHFISDIR